MQWDASTWPLFSEYLARAEDFFELLVERRSEGRDLVQFRFTQL